MRSSARLRSFAALRRLEARTLAAFLCVAAGLWLFLNVAGEVTKGETRALDERLLLALRVPGAPADPVGPRWVEEAMRDVTALGGFTVLTLVTLTAVMSLLIYKHRRQALVTAAVVLAAQASSEILKAVYDRPRPSLVPHGSFVYSQSFPSGHSTLSAATYLILAAVIAGLAPLRRTRMLAYNVAAALVIAVGLSRVYLGVHWPSDVLAGWSLGTAWAFVGWAALRPARAGGEER